MGFGKTKRMRDFSNARLVLALTYLDYNQNLWSIISPKESNSNGIRNGNFSQAAEWNNKSSQEHTRGVSCPNKLSSRISLSSLVADTKSVDGELCAGREWECLDSAWLPLSARGVEGVLTDFVPHDLSLVPEKALNPVSRFWIKEKK